VRIESETSARSSGSVTAAGSAPTGLKTEFLRLTGTAHAIRYIEGLPVTASLRPSIALQVRPRRRIAMIPFPVMERRRDRFSLVTAVALLVTGVVMIAVEATGGPPTSIRWSDRILRTAVADVFGCTGESSLLEGNGFIVSATIDRESDDLRVVLFDAAGRLNRWDAVARCRPESDGPPAVAPEQGRPEWFRLATGDRKSRDKAARRWRLDVEFRFDRIAGGDTGGGTIEKGASTEFVFYPALGGRGGGSPEYVFPGLRLSARKIDDAARRRIDPDAWNVVILDSAVPVPADWRVWRVPAAMPAPEREDAGRLPPPPPSRR